MARWQKPERPVSSETAPSNCPASNSIGSALGSSIYYEGNQDHERCQNQPQGHTDTPRNTGFTRHSFSAQIATASLGTLLLFTEKNSSAGLFQNLKIGRTLRQEIFFSYSPSLDKFQRLLRRRPQHISRNSYSHKK